METYYATERSYFEARAHPYEQASPDQSGFIDFKARPDLIRTELEDFRIFSRWPAIETFYSFLEWMNGVQSHLETNDCAFRPPAAHGDPNSDLPLAAHGRVIVMYRDLHLNSLNALWLCDRLFKELQRTDQAFTAREGVVGLTLTPVIQLALSKANRLPNGLLDVASNDPGFGKHLMLSFWSYGIDDAEVFQNLSRTFTNIWAACKVVSSEIGLELNKGPIGFQLAENK